MVVSEIDSHELKWTKHKPASSYSKVKKMGLHSKLVLQRRVASAETTGTPTQTTQTKYAFHCWWQWEGNKISNIIIQIQYNHAVNSISLVERLEVFNIAWPGSTVQMHSENISEICKMCCCIFDHVGNFQLQSRGLRTGYSLQPLPSKHLSYNKNSQAQFLLTLPAVYEQRL